MTLEILTVVGARPNFMKAAPVHETLAREAGVVSRIVHTGQHYDNELSDVFFEELGLPEPHVHLGVGSGTHAGQTARIMLAFEEVLAGEAPDALLVVGDVNSTLACALVAAKMGVPVGHVEAGLRSFDDRMPEEINRRLTDQLSRWLFVTEQSGVDNLRREGHPEERIHFVGNVMIDSLKRCRGRARDRGTQERLGLTGESYVLVTMHRPVNVDERPALTETVRTIEVIAADTTVVFPIHPRTRERLVSHGLRERLDTIEGLRVLDPLGYLDFLNLLEGAAVVVTDSGGIQEETTFLGVPCLTVRESTERPVTVEIGTNRLVTLDAGEIAAAVREMVDSRDVASGRIPPRWDGRAAERIVRVLLESL